MTIELLEAPIDKNIKVKCLCCEKPIKKKAVESWKVYSNRKYCDKICLSRHREQEKFNDSQAIQMDDGKELPIGKYLERKTVNGRLQADIYLGIAEAVQSHPDSDDKVLRCSKCNSVYFGYYYKGLLITTDLASKAIEWLTMNTFGRAGQRKAPDEKPKRTLQELQSRLRFLIKKLVKDKVVANKIIVLLEGEGL